MKVYTDFAEALENRPADGMSLCGTYRGEKPQYFWVPADASEDQMREYSFEVRHGRPLSTYEKFLLEAARQIAESEAA